jgi:hypothetical protein
VNAQGQTRRRLIALLQLAYSGEKAAALAYQGHARSVSDPAEKEMIEKIEKDECVHREKVGRLLTRLDARPLPLREIRSSAIGHVLSFLCRFSGWFLPMYFAGKLETNNVCEYEKAAGWAGSWEWTFSCRISMRWLPSRSSTRGISSRGSGKRRR